MRHVLNPLFEDSMNVEKVIAKGIEGVESVLVANHSSIAHYLGYLVNSGLKKYEAGAYLWHYQYADIEGAIEAVTRVVEQYQLMVSSENSYNQH